ncbi:alanyl-tRNA synthetase [Marinitoga hydrogenitolerans DSM 16785]|uniref:Alanine--tRNA ligase n=1 Tax=Marinitoga hydrogenitolerans (strain DSM 16785 / JCM 12826 / AT1271) TaxID=1122195 RepID=A0A1M4U5R7_MARH1|nr:alanine--tRNA ligase [Marinitoga hydrogenitolerans]SHE51887.1 alanyl-tRNA synthetase [Marinitoga hydrogenitolerans DSM 16785]
MNSKEIRKAFLDYFEKNDHKIMKSFPLIPSDPQLLFTVAGMVPFKPIFWGKVEPTYTKIATCQKCLRTNDIENVGRTARHQTFFEMLGNFSFGDYFKEGAIKFAWEFLTEVLKLPKEKLWVSVYLDDDDAYNIWKNVIGFPEEKIIRMGKEDNWWGPVGPSGPCGPCSEIYYDTGRTDLCSNPEKCTPEDDCGRYVEIWNLVFTEYYQDENGNLSPLPRKNIDTGAGLERITAAVQGVYDNFETDLFTPIINKIENIFNIKFRENEKTDVSIKVIADHSRAVSFLVSEGILPSNEGRGYVLRRILRRALRHGALLGKKEPFLNEVIEVVLNSYGDIYPEIIEKSSFIKNIVEAEEKRFLETLDKGTEKLINYINNSKEKKIDGRFAFELYDTYGFPLDITKEIAEEHGFKVDENDFNKQMELQRKRAREAAGEKEYTKMNPAFKFIGENLKSTKFTGYEKIEDESIILYLVKNEEIIESAKEGEEIIIISRNTPFYAEKGGQIGDTGIIKNDNFKFKVTNTKIINNEVIGHFGKILNGEVKTGDNISLYVDKQRRDSIRKNHTATHLLHKALRDILGNHVKQAGSLVTDEKLRFDFTHFEAVSKNDIKKIEKLVNEKILENIKIVTEIKKLDEAKSENVMALFEEKYGNQVRVVKISDFSAELCGGTHVSYTGEIGLFKITSETAVSAGVRRIEAITGIKSLEYLNNLEETLNTISEHLEAAQEIVVSRILNLLDTIKEQEKEIKKLQEKLTTQSIDVFNIKEINGINVYIKVFENVAQDVLRNVTDIAENKVKSGIIILFNKKDKKVNFIVKITKDLVGQYHAGNIAKNIAKELGGGGGGRPDFAQAGGKEPSKINGIINNIEKFLRG